MPPAQIHPTACVDEPVTIGDDTHIWHFCHVMSGARIGRDCNIGQNVYIDRDVQIGDGCKLQNNVSVYKGVTLEDGVFCGPSMVFTNVVNPRAFIERKTEFRETRVKKGSTLGANCTIVCGVNIGQYALVGAGAVVTRDVPDFAMVVGVPARQAGWVSEEGFPLKAGPGHEEFTCPETGKHYHLSPGGFLTPK
ncbi:MAG: N-acetyltransferase [Gemmatimonadetes bacterium]|jgi:UDP-2-acetamido-3-amino-2,3-dideoxy-glucuronate N-acetyltransferase|nr:N-acetyltransferase [Gemmatimonadota bacterium]MBT6149570.1 N-acetyltransferase [Gemmatimonadota bacterium]MBT7863838.1 N-acetyltransferase [Gemmatimonadota bacterium]